MSSLHLARNFSGLDSSATVNTFQHHRCKDFKTFMTHVIKLFDAFQVFDSGALKNPSKKSKKNRETVTGIKDGNSDPADESSRNWAKQDRNLSIFLYSSYQSKDYAPLSYFCFKICWFFCINQRKISVRRC